jgi:hypothetical protein
MRRLHPAVGNVAESRRFLRYLFSSVLDPYSFYTDTDPDPTFWADTDPNPIQIQGFDDQKLKKIYS